MRHQQAGLFTACQYWIFFFLILTIIKALDPVYKISSFIGPTDSVVNLLDIVPTAIVVDQNILYVGHENQILAVDLINHNTSNVAGLEGGPSGGLATQTPLGYVRGVAMISGELYISEGIGYVVRKVNKNGIIESFAGTLLNSNPPLGDGGPALNAVLGGPFSIAQNPLTGDVYIADYNFKRVRVVYANGTISTIAGNGTNIYYGGQAIQTGIGSPTGVAFCPIRGVLYITIPSGYRILQVNVSSGIISTFARTGEREYTGDGGLAVNAGLFHPYSVCVGLNGEVYFVEDTKNVVRKVSTDGIITTIAGKPDFGFEGDGDLATNALLHMPNGITVASNGEIYISDNGNLG